MNVFLSSSASTCTLPFVWKKNWLGSQCVLTSWTCQVSTWRALERTRETRTICTKWLHCETTVLCEYLSNHLKCFYTLWSVDLLCRHFKWSYAGISVKIVTSWCSTCICKIMKRRVVLTCTCKIMKSMPQTRYYEYRNDVEFIWKSVSLAFTCIKYPG
jgi:hypothetical protein